MGKVDEGEICGGGKMTDGWEEQARGTWEIKVSQ